MCGRSPLCGGRGITLPTYASTFKLGLVHYVHITSLPSLPPSLSSLPLLPPLPSQACDEDVSQFDPKFTQLAPIDSPVDTSISESADLNFQGFSYVAPSLLAEELESQALRHRPRSATDCVLIHVHVHVYTCCCIVLQAIECYGIHTGEAALCIMLLCL